MYLFSTEVPHRTSIVTSEAHDVTCSKSHRHPPYCNCASVQLCAILEYFPQVLKLVVHLIIRLTFRGVLSHGAPRSPSKYEETKFCCGSYTISPFERTDIAS